MSITSEFDIVKEIKNQRERERERDKFFPNESDQFSTFNIPQDKEEVDSPIAFCWFLDFHKNSFTT
jgi:hypothetical protein